MLNMLQNYMPILKNILDVCYYNVKLNNSNKSENEITDKSLKRVKFTV